MIIKIGYEPELGLESYFERHSTESMRVIQNLQIKLIKLF